jgi:hypothetical protein
MDLQASVDRAERELVRLGEHGLDTQTWFHAANAPLSRAVGFDGSCWQTNDPATALITSHLTLNLPSGFPLLAANEYLAEDVNRFADLAARPHPVGLLGQATDGQPERSLRWREMLRPNGFDAELRVALVDGAGCWGSLILVRDRGRPDFEPETVAAVERLAGTLAAGLRRTVVAQQATVEPPAHGPGLVVLDHRGQVESLTPAARHWLDHLGQDPPVLSAVAATAQASGPARARVRTPTGHWLILHGAGWTATHNAGCRSSSSRPDPTSWPRCWSPPTACRTGSRRWPRWCSRAARPARSPGRCTSRPTPSRST